jgi:hypothetical protein
MGAVGLHSGEGAGEHITVKSESGLPGDRRRTLHNLDTAVFTSSGAVKAMPACIICCPFLWAGLCVPFIIACDSVATSLSFKLTYVVVRDKVR